jgi:hypothetical protein
MRAECALMREQQTPYRSASHKLIGGPAAEALGAVRLPLSRDSRTRGPYTSDRAPVTPSAQDPVDRPEIGGPMAQQIIMDTPPNCARPKSMTACTGRPSHLARSMITANSPSLSTPHAYRRSLK